MKKKLPSDLLSIYLLPTFENMVKGGAVLYLLGITCTFFYYAQFNILSVDYLKPNAIIVGIFQWVYFIFFPRSALLFIYTSTKPHSSVKRSIWLFTFFLLLGNMLFFFLTGNFTANTLLTILLLTGLVLAFHIDYPKRELHISPPLLRTYFFFVIFCICFSYFMFPNIPYEIGGGQPIKVQVTTSDTTLLKSRFSKSTYLLYATENDYYFIEKKQDAETKAIYQYLVKKLDKSEIKKIEFTKSIWQPF